MPSVLNSVNNRPLDFSVSIVDPTHKEYIIHTAAKYGDMFHKDGNVAFNLLTQFWMDISTVIIKLGFLLTKIFEHH